MNEQTSMTFLDTLKIFPQYFLPHHFLSAIMHKLTRCEQKAFKNLMIQQIAKRYNVDMTDAVEPDLTAYPSFNHFFTRALKPEARPICSEPNSIACPVDGAISQIGDIKADQIFQAKGHDYSIKTLLGNDDSYKKFINGKFATIYLSPKDYHRIHTPIDGSLEKMIHIPGRLFSVNEVTATHVPGLFARNERVLSLFQTSAGPMAVILVGAIFVSSMETVWEGTITPPAGFQIRTWDYEKRNSKVRLDKGSELGRFNMGSTVILLFPEDSMTWNETLFATNTVKMGQDIGSVV